MEPAPLRDSVFLEAERALGEGRPWRATRVLSPLLAAPARRTPDALLLAARAAAGWSGWTTVLRLLAGERWLDAEAGGEGRAMQARAAVERGNPGAVGLALLAVNAASDSAARPRFVTLARALDTAGQLDSAAAVFRRAAELLPGAGDWLLLRAAGATADSAARAALYAGVTAPAAAARVRWTEARARGRTGDPAGAARIYDQLGARFAAVRMRLLAAATRIERAAVRRELVDLLTPRLSAADARDAIGLLDETFAPLSDEEELAVARRAAATDDLARAARAFARAATPGGLEAQDRHTYGTVLARLGRHREAIAAFDLVRDPAFRAAARYQRARSLLRGASRTRALAALAAVADQFPRDTASAAAAGYLIGDLLADSREDRAARARWLTVARRYPTTAFGERAAFQAALLAYLDEDLGTARGELDALAERRGPSGEGPAALYWAGRLALLSGDSTGAELRWRRLLERSPASYYALPAASRLGVPLPGPEPGEAPAADPATLAATERADYLRSLGLEPEAVLELDQAMRDAERSPAALLAAARAFLERGESGRALRLAQRAADRGAPQDAALLRLLYPLPRPAELGAEAEAQDVDPFLAAALIRQESGFDAAARSRADARGLMQVLPGLGGQLARREELDDWDPVLLYQPDLNLHFGLTHLAELLGQYRRVEHALAAYNAGGRPLGGWLRRRGVEDREVFIERIPYVETRDYVRRVLRNRAHYEALYGS